jgi:Lrp/AsnC family transcriptional regulator, leucine-responsive regulatory protein
MASKSSKETYDALLKTLDGRKKVALDKLDLRILNALQANNRLTNLELAQLVGLSPPTCLRRVRRLREERVITGDVSVVDFNKLGDYLTFIVSVVLREEVRSNMAQMERQFRALPEVTQCYLVTGDTDYLLVVVVRTMRDYEQFTQDVLYANSAVLRFTTLTVMKSVKFSVGIPLEDAED